MESSRVMDVEGDSVDFTAFLSPRNEPKESATYSGTPSSDYGISSGMTPMWSEISESNKDFSESNKENSEPSVEVPNELNTPKVDKKMYGILNESIIRENRGVIPKTSTPNPLTINLIPQVNASDEPTKTPLDVRPVPYAPKTVIGQKNHRVKKGRKVAKALFKVSEDGELVRNYCDYNHAHFLKKNSVVFGAHLNSLVYSGNSTALRLVLQGNDRVPLMQDYICKHPPITGTGLNVTVKWQKISRSGCIWINTSCPNKPNLLLSEVELNEIISCIMRNMDAAEFSVILRQKFKITRDRETFSITTQNCNITIKSEKFGTLFENMMSAREITHILTFVHSQRDDCISFSRKMIRECTCEDLGVFKSVLITEYYSLAMSKSGNRYPLLPSEMVIADLISIL